MTKIRVRTQPYNKVVKLTREQEIAVQSNPGTGQKVRVSNTDGIRVQNASQGVAVVHSGIYVPNPPIINPPSEGGTTVERIADIPISGHRCVVDTEDGVAYLSLADLSHGERILGISLNAAGVGDPILIQYSGEVTEPSWNWVPDLPIFPTNFGLLTQTPPTSGFIVNIGFASSETSIFINIQQAIYL